MDDVQLPLFVFGTLRRGYSNHHLLAGRFTKSMSAILPGYFRVRPLMIVPRSGSQVSGELYFLRNEAYSRTLRDCDELEGIPLGELCGPYYARVRVLVETSEGTFDAWAYVHAGE